MRKSSHYLERHVSEKNEYPEVSEQEDVLRKKGSEQWDQEEQIEIQRGDIRLNFKVKKIVIDYANQSERIQRQRKNFFKWWKRCD